MPNACNGVGYIKNKNNKVKSANQYPNISISQYPNFQIAFPTILAVQPLYYEYEIH